MSKSKILSIITVVYNDIEIEETIKSVIPFLSEDIEYIVVDGGSKDGTKDIIDKYSRYLGYWVSEADNGIYDAMNKAVLHASGEYVLHLNSGDLLSALPVDLLKLHNDSVDILTFPVLIDNTFVYYPLFDNRVKFRTSLHHQGTFYRRNLVDYDCAYKIFADFDLNQRLYKQGVKCKIFDAPIISNHFENGVSAKTPRRRDEYSCIIRKNFGSFYVLVFYFHLLYKFIKGRKSY